MFALCNQCNEKYSDFYELISMPAKNISKEKIDDIAESADISKFVIEETFEKLKLWGLLPINENGTIYFVKSTYNHEIKIGFTSGDVFKRLSSLQTSHPYQLELLTTIPGDTVFEKSLHKQFEQYRLKGEWFKPHPELVFYISSIK